MTVGGRERMSEKMREEEKEVEWERIYVKVKETQVHNVCILLALPGEVLIFTVTGIAFSPVFCTNNITLPSSSFTV